MSSHVKIIILRLHCRSFCPPLITVVLVLYCKKLRALIEPFIRLIACYLARYEQLGFKIPEV